MVERQIVALNVAGSIPVGRPNSLETLKGNLMAKSPQNLSFEPFEKALVTLESALKSSPKNDLERDGVIQRFEFSFELAWKSIRTLLLAMGRSEVSSSPRPLFREAHGEGLIDSFEDWNGFLEARNQTVHTYNASAAQQVYDEAKRFAAPARRLLEKLKSKASSF